jgi:NAD+ synthase
LVILNAICLNFIKMKPLEKVQFISKWIKSYTEMMPSKAQALIIGISGGIDSSVSSTLCAMTGLKTVVLSMPIKQKLSQHDLSLKHQEWLVKKFKNVEAHTINLDQLFETFKNSLSQFDSELGLANSRARLRMTTLYQVAAANKGIVVGTGNKVEDFGVGFYTKYGDGGVDISPIADCNKTEVWEIGRELNILQEIVEAAPTDGLWDDGRTDEGQLGLRYKELEEAMNNIYSKNRVKYEKIRQMNLHKMEAIPVCKIPN